MKSVTTYITILVLVALILLQPIAHAAASSPLQPQALVDPRIPDSGTVEVLIALDPLPAATLSNVADIDDKIKLLKEWAIRSQTPVKDAIRALGGEVVRSFWITNAMLVRIDAGRILELASIEGINVIVLNTDDVRLLNSPMRSVEAEQAIIENWGVEAVNATGAWNLGYLGNGVRILVIDTGLYIDHVTLQGKLLTLDPTDPTYPGGWIRITDDGLLACSFPADTNGHGTFVASLALGGSPATYKIGVAPAATLMAAQAFQGATATPAQVLAAFEWAANPKFCNGTETGIRPHIVSFSAGFSTYAETFLLDAIKNLLNLNIVVVAAIGNNGPGTTVYPGNMWGVYGIGAIDNTSTVANFSGGAQVLWNNIPADWPFKPPYPSTYIKPDFVAPGVNVIGAGLSANAFTAGNGTSYATPHIAGVTALILEALGALDHRSPIPGKILAEIVYDILVNASTDLGDPGQDDRYGYGLPDAGKAVLLAEEIVRVYQLNVTITPERARVGDRVTLLVPAPQDFTIPNGTLFKLYMGNEQIATLEWNNGIQANFTVPETPRGQYNITIIDETLRYTGSTQLTVEPSIEAPPRAIQGYALAVTLHGHDAQTTYILLLDGSPVANVTTNNLGTGRATIQIPEDAALGEHILESRDANTAETLALATITVATSLVPDALYLQASGPQTIEVGSEATVYLAAYTVSGLVDVNLTITLYTPTGPATLTPVQVDQGVYKVSYTPLAEGYYTLVAKASLALQDIILNASTIHVAYATTATTSMLEALADINDTLDSISSDIASLKTLSEQANRSLTTIETLTESILDQLSKISQKTDIISGTLNETRNIAEDTRTLLHTMNTTLIDRLMALDYAITLTSENITSITRQTLQETQNINSKLATIEQETQTIRAILQQLNQTITTIVGTVATLQESLSDTRLILEAMNTSIAGIQTAIQELKTGISALAEDINMIKQRLDTVAAKIDDTVSGIQALRDKVDTIAATLEQQIAEITGIKEKQETLREESIAARMQAEEAASLAGQARILAGVAAVAAIVAAALGIIRRS